jgi:hypothetical protein
MTDKELENFFKEVQQTALSEAKLKLGKHGKSPSDVTINLIIENSVKATIITLTEYHRKLHAQQNVPPSLPQNPQ